MRGGDGVSDKLSKQKDSGLNFLKDTNIIQNLLLSLFLGMMVAVLWSGLPGKIMKYNIE